MKNPLRYLTICCSALLMLCGCRRLDTIPYSPVMTPDEFLRSTPFVHVHLGSLDFILSQPLSTFLVYFVGLYTVYVGLRFLLDQRGQQSRMWWGIGLLLTGLGALAAGTSYQAFGYELKCNGRETCTWTSWWEVMYMMLSVPGMGAYLIACATSTANPRLRRFLKWYAAIVSAVYCCILLYCALMPVRFFVSFDFMGVVCTPSLLILLLLHSMSFRKEGTVLNQYLFYAWMIFLSVTITYFWYMWLGIGPRLWRHGIWFTDNDVLHTGMIFWIFYIHTRLLDRVKDE